MNTIDLEVQDMSCGSCVKHVTQALKPLPGVSGVDVDLHAGRVRVHGDLAQGSDALVSALEAAGYPAQVAAASTPGQPDARQRQRPSALLLRMKQPDTP
ncbi:heavy metal-associated domain-containing protein [Ramlibacter sp. H39-3-26]|uniref:heavy-metal-associated domain-containing protein n=1 Tax=Curvibacter soli TaxID=3031331 RepID=UPI0023DCCE44|nr:heavy metal-associated domain-containing protein [Ramlibacter sp. H39-3-26]MDF1484919.1 heavy metal-associated domain-containing protein [Ramlibacter sp. H39-3-26]